MIDHLKKKKRTKGKNTTRIEKIINPVKKKRMNIWKYKINVLYIDDTKRGNQFTFGRCFKTYYIRFVIELNTTWINLCRLPYSWSTFGHCNRKFVRLKHKHNMKLWWSTNKKNNILDTMNRIIIWTIILLIIYRSNFCKLLKYVL